MRPAVPIERRPARETSRAPESELPRVAVIGGGLAGLATVYELVRLTRTEALPLEIRLYDAGEPLGGSIRSVRREGFLLEEGADCIDTGSDACLKLAVELGLAAELIPARIERGVHIWWDGALHPLPPGLSTLATGGVRELFRSSLLSTMGKLRAGLERLVPGRRSASDESVAAFVRRRFGRQMLARVGDPVLAGAQAGDPSLLGVRYAFPRLAAMEREHGSVARGLRQQVQDREASREAFPGIPEKVTRSPRASFREGMQALVDALVDSIRQRDTGALHPGRRVVRLRPAGDPIGAAAYSVELDDGRTWIADICVLALPARAAGELLEPFAPEISVELGAVPYASSVHIQLGYQDGNVGRKPETMECLVPHSQGRPVSSCTPVHRKFDFRAPAGAGLVCVRMGGMRKPEVLRADDATLVHMARQEVETLLGIRAEPRFAEVLRQPRAHPQYTVEHGDRVTAVAEYLELHSGLLIAGSALHGTRPSELVENGRSVAAVVGDLARSRLL